MCIRDRLTAVDFDKLPLKDAMVVRQGNGSRRLAVFADPNCCLLYTSDAADERSSVDLGGRRIIKKKKDRRRGERCSSRTTTHNR